MWHYYLAAVCAVPCFAVWTYVGTHESFSSITPISLYGLSFLGNMVSIAQPAALAYRTATLYGAAEQAVGGATMIAALSIASILGPQIYPNKDSPWFKQGFAASCSTLAICIATHLTLPVWLLIEAKKRKRKTGHAMPIRAMEDAEHAMISAVALARLHEVNKMEEKTALDVEQATQLETIRDESEK